MYDYGLSTLEQYGLTASFSARTRGALLCRTEQGTLIIREFKGSENKLLIRQKLLEKLEQNGLQTDSCIPNQEGSLISRDRDGICYILQHWPEGRECDVRSREDILKSVRILAEYHRHMRLSPEEMRGISENKDLDTGNIEVSAETPGGEAEKEYNGAADKNMDKPSAEKYRAVNLGIMCYTEQPLDQEYQRHNQELRKIRRYIRSRGASCTFEKDYLASVEGFLQKGEEALELLKDSVYRSMREEAAAAGRVCHGEYSQHNVLMQKQGAAVINFDRWYCGVQTADLYYFMRKILEKHRWDISLGLEMLREYHSLEPLNRNEWQYLKIRFTYPDKFWKLANYYYTHNKAWISAKNTEKLKKVISQKNIWDRFGRECFERYPFDG